MISLVRVDNRLLHGQILETWVPRLGIDQVVVADDDAADSELAKAAMTLCVPPSLPVRIEPIDRVDFGGLAAGRDKVLLLVRDPAGLERARAAGLTPALVRKVNLGNLHFEPGRKQVTPSVFLSAAELDELRSLAAQGFEVEARAIPSEPPTGMADIERRYAAGR
ncbi:PTS sugar transporter subunit IIB [Anaeromyxobacter oryzisoli]|uniref:PTS sugar transporter subunit IIB n=1 Tax=Anaeromyxobacter oryzisoli TaxID=2925408 RepID=UPI001F5A2BBC|nr:PTS sugar transporter subunit IIB [Anaeromyxobacter sp. SG63]